MTARDRQAGLGRRLADAAASMPPAYRALSLLAAALLTATYLSVLYHVVDVVGGVGGVGVFGLVVLGSGLLAVGLSRSLPPGLAVVLGGFLLVAGVVVYLATVPQAYVNLVRQVADTVGLLTGLSVLRMTKAGTWALGLTPAPVFLSWYFVLRRSYVSGALVGAGTLGFFVLTGDVDTVLGLVGVLAAVAVIGFGDLDRRPEAAGPAGSAPAPRSAMGWQLSRRMVLMAVVTTSVSLVPGGEARPLLPNRGRGTVEASLTEAPDRVQLQGSISLSPEVRFTVRAEEAAYWRVGDYDRYTGGGWVRTGPDPQPYTGSLDYPEGDSLRRVRQTYTVESSLGVMPAAWKPVRVGVGAASTLVTDTGAVQPAGRLQPGSQYSVESRRNTPTEGELRAAGADYPEWVRERYLQLPQSTPERVATFTEELTANAATAYDAARVIERWLTQNKRYSLDVDRPDGDIVDAFLFDRSAGYCTYYASAMVVMLRTRSIPARFVVGYTTGEPTDENRWTVRGFNSHAWVEVYFPSEGWVEFDPTPSGPRAAAERARLEQARAAGEAAVDLETPAPAEPVFEEETPGVLADDPNSSAAGSTPDDISSPAPGGEGAGGAPGSGGSAGSSIELPSARTAVYGLLLFVGAATVAREAGVTERLYREVWLRQHPEGPPADRVEAAYERAEYLLGRRFRRRRPTETPREYLRAARLGEPDLRPAMIERLERLVELRERARFGGGVTEAEAGAAVEVLRALVGRPEAA